MSVNKMDYLIGIDIGTTGTKTLVVREDGRIAGRATAGYALRTPAPGWAEQEPSWWVKAAAASVRAALENARIAPGRVAAVSLSGQMHGLVALDARTQPVCPAILWCDQRTFAARAFIEKRVGLKRLLDATFNPPLEGFTAPKIIWLKNNAPEAFSRMAKFVLPKDYVRYHLTGQLCAEESDAAGTALYDVAHNRWAWDVIDALDLDAGIFPAVRRSIDPAGVVTAAASRRFGLLAGTPVIAGGADNTCAAVGTGIVRAGRVSSSIGSSGVIFAHTDAPVRDPEARVHTFNHSAPGKWYLMGVMLSAGLSLRWFRDTFAAREMDIEKRTGRDAYGQLTQLAATAPPGAGGVTFLPYLSGERTPHKNPHARGVFFGISHATTRADMARAVMEGIAFGLKDSLDIIESVAGFKTREVRATGGGAKSPFLRQLQADVFGRPVATLNHDEGPAFGAALIAGTGAGVYPSINTAVEKTVKIKENIKPDKQRHATYAKLHKKFQSLYKSMEKEFVPGE